MYLCYSLMFGPQIQFATALVGNLVEMGVCSFSNESSYSIGRG